MLVIPATAPLHRLLRISCSAPTAPRSSACVSADIRAAPGCRRALATARGRPRGRGARADGRGRRASSRCCSGPPGRARRKPSSTTCASAISDGPVDLCPRGGARPLEEPEPGPTRAGRPGGRPGHRHRPLRASADRPRRARVRAAQRGTGPRQESAPGRRGARAGRRPSARRAPPRCRCPAGAGPRGAARPATETPAPDGDRADSRSTWTQRAERTLTTPPWSPPPPAKRPRPEQAARTGVLGEHAGRRRGAAPRRTLVGAPTWKARATPPRSRPAPGGAQRPSP